MALGERRGLPGRHDPVQPHRVHAESSDLDQRQAGSAGRDSRAAGGAATLPCPICAMACWRWAIVNMIATAFGHRLDAWLRHQGARPLFDLIEVDNGDAGALRHWQHQLSVLSGRPDLPDWEAPTYQRRRPLLSSCPATRRRRAATMAGWTSCSHATSPSAATCSSACWNAQRRSRTGWRMAPRSMSAAACRAWHPQSTLHLDACVPCGALFY